MTVFDTLRLRLRRLELEDAPFILELVNDPDWLRFIGDRGVHDLDGARRYIVEGPHTMQARHGFSLYCVTAKEDGSPLGMCGLIKRDNLEDVDLGFAFLDRCRGRGYAREAAACTLAHAQALGLKRLAAITDPENARSIHLLEQLGFRFQESRSFKPEEPPLKVFLWQV